MLLQLSVKNFRSIREWATLSMIPLERLNKHDGKLSNIFHPSDATDVSALKVAVIYGKNASGKSNLLLAIKALTYLVGNANKYDESQTIPPYEPYLFNNDSFDMPCEMEVDFLGANGYRYNYSISYSKSEVLKEKLVFYPKKQPATLFDRENNLNNNEPKLEFGPQFKGDRRFLKEKNITNKLLLSEFKGSEYTHTKEAYDFFKNIALTTTSSSRGSADAHDVMNLKSITKMLGKLKGENISQYDEIIGVIVGILKAADTGIEGLEVIESENATSTDDFDKDNFQVLTHHIYFENGKKTGIKKVSIFKESTGTIKLFALLHSLFLGISKGSLIALDELDRSLHPLITRSIIDMVYKVSTKKYQETKPNLCPQLIFTTHDSSLLDKDLFRRDQIWFTDTDDYLSTVLYCMAEIKGVRKDTPYSDWYLTGRFGATPITSEFKI
jgi:AAA15 family ATPase/GTPase